MFRFFGIILVSLTWVNSWASTIIKTSPCNGQNGTCSPNWCSPVSNAACVDTTADLTDVQSPMNSLGCKVCTQSTSSKCTSSYLNSVLKTGGGLLAVYCNDDYLVVYSSGEAVHKDGLKYIPRPPGETGVAYASACVTRSYHTAAAFYKVPLNPVMLSTANASNNLYLFSGQTDPGNIINMGLPESGPASVSVSGQSIFPLYNNIGSIAHADCEMDLCSAHAGQGFDYHYHGDPFHPVAGTCMYSLDDYGSDTDHPPLIGWGLDGFEIYGRHISYTYDLDTCGGHQHADSDGVTPMTYHYHSQVLNKTSASGHAYTTYIAGVNNCWRGNISEVKFFGNSVAFESRPDFDLLKPCCDSTEYYTASGVSLVVPTVSPTSLPPTKKPTKSPTASPSTIKPSSSPARQPTVVPSILPSVQPTLAPSRNPSAPPSTTGPSVSPSLSPSAVPTTTAPSVNPSLTPSALPSVTPSLAPSVMPTLTMSPSEEPTVRPTPSPSVVPTTLPSGAPSYGPSFVPTAIPSVRPSLVPSAVPSVVPSVGPSYVPSLQSEPIVRFTTSTTISGLSSDTLTASDETAVVNATATALGVSVDYVTYTSSEVVGTTRRQLKAKSTLSGTTYTLSVGTSVSVPLIGYQTTNATAAFHLLSAAFDSAITGGDFVRYLTAAATTGGSVIASSPSIAVDSHSIDNEEVVNPPSYQPTKEPSGGSSNAVLQGTILYVVIAVGGAVFLSVMLYCINLCLGARSHPDDGQRSNTRVADGSERPNQNHQSIELAPTALGIEEVYEGGDRVGHGNTMGF